MKNFVKFGCLGWFVLSLVGVMTAALSPRKPDPPTPAAAPAPETREQRIARLYPKYDGAKKADRRNFIAELQQKGMVGTIRMGGSGVIHVDVGDPFILTPKSFKSSIGGVAMAWALDQGQEPSVVVFDDYRTGRKLGSWDQWGLSW